jgi:hypothetical protein
MVIVIWITSRGSGIWCWWILLWTLVIIGLLSFVLKKNSRNYIGLANRIASVAVLSLSSLFMLLALVFSVISVWNMVWYEQEHLPETQTSASVSAALPSISTLPAPSISPVPTAAPTPVLTPTPPQETPAPAINPWIFEKKGYRVALYNEGEVWTAKLSGVDVKEYYPVNLLENDMEEYGWHILFDIGDERYLVGTLYFCGSQRSKDMVSLQDMQSDLMKQRERAPDDLGVSYLLISKANLTVEGDTLIWTFRLTNQYEPSEVGIVDLYILEAGEPIVY